MTTTDELDGLLRAAMSSAPAAEAMALGIVRAGLRGPRPVACAYACPAERDAAPQRGTTAARTERSAGGCGPPAGAAGRDQRGTRYRAAGGCRFRRPAGRGRIGRQADDDGGPTGQAHRRRDPGPLPHRRDRERLHPSFGVVAGAAVRRREAHRDLAAVRDRRGPGTGARGYSTRLCAVRTGGPTCRRPDGWRCSSATPTAAAMSGRWPRPT